jgi:hypothetical protein
VRGPTGVARVAGYEIASGTGIQGNVASFTIDQHSVTDEISAADAEAANREIRKLRDVDIIVRAPPQAAATIAPAAPKAAVGR